MDEKRDIKKELEKVDIYYEDLTTKEKSMLDLANSWMKNKYNNSKNQLLEIKRYDYSVREFCIDCNINRTTLYKKNKKGENSYKAVITFINSRGKQYKELTRDLISVNQSNSTDDIKEKIDKLVKRDVEYIELKNKLVELERKIKSLEKENKELIKKQGMA